MYRQAAKTVEAVTDTPYIIVYRFSRHLSTKKASDGAHGGLVLYSIFSHMYSVQALENKGVRQMQKNNFPCVEINPSVRPSFAETLENIKEQIEYDCFPTEMQEQVQEVAAIVADVFRMQPQDRIPIDKALRTVSDVQEIYSRLQYEHILNVIERFNKISYQVKSPMMYLRSMLYKEVFEYTSAEANLFRYAQGDSV